MPSTNEKLADLPAWRDADALLLAVFRFTQEAFVDPAKFDPDLAKQLRREARNIEECIRRSVQPQSSDGPGDGLGFAIEDLDEIDHLLTLCGRLGYGDHGTEMFKQVAKVREGVKALRVKLLTSK